MMQRYGLQRLLCTAFVHLGLSALPREQLASVLPTASAYCRPGKKCYTTDGSHAGRMLRTGVLTAASLKSQRNWELFDLTRAVFVLGIKLPMLI